MANLRTDQVTLLLGSPDDPTSLLDWRSDVTVGSALIIGVISNGEC